MGCILFQLVTGRVPFEAENFMGVLSLHLTQPPPVIPPEVFDSIGAPRVLAQVIERALAKDKDQRFATIDDFARAVRQASGDKITGPVATQANVPAPPGASGGRVKTQWTGNLSVPEMDPVAPPRKSRLPIFVGAAILAGGAAAAAAVLVTRGGPPPSSGSASGAPPASGPAAVPPGPGPVPPPMPAPPMPPPPPPRDNTAPLTFERARIKLDSEPSHAEVRDPASGTLLGHTPFTFTLPASHTPRQFALHHKDYVDAVVEIVPELDRINYTEPLERGAPGQPPVVHRADPGRAAAPTRRPRRQARPGQARGPRDQARPGQARGPRDQAGPGQARGPRDQAGPTAAPARAAARRRQHRAQARSVAGRRRNLERPERAPGGGSGSARGPV